LNDFDEHVSFLFTSFCSFSSFFNDDFDDDDGRQRLLGILID